MQAEHIPVHLGSMPDAVAAVLGEEQRPGVDWILNDPYRGGTHLPDITLVSPVFVDGELLGFAASRAHHADVGGPTPGCDAGLLATPRRRGRGDPADPRRRRDAGRAWPPQMRGAAPAARRPARPGSRQPGRRAAPGRARRAPRAASSCAPGWPRSSPTPSAAPAPRSPRCPTASTRAEDVLEDDSPDGQRARRRACGSTATIDGETPAPRLRRHRPAGRRQPQLPALGDQIGRVLRRPRRSPTPTRRPRPAPTGRSRSIAPPGCLLNAEPPAAVAAGNVETSSRVADLVIAALAGARPVPAQGQGTMNNLTLANERLHLLRDARRRPGRLPRRRRPERDPRGDVEHAQHPDRGAGDRVPAARARSSRFAAAAAARAPTAAATGIVRELEALAPMRFTLITERRRHAPRGRDGGADGAPGENLLNGEPLPGKADGRSGSRRPPADRNARWRRSGPA